MKVQYEVETAGELKIRDSSKRMIILHDCYWETQRYAEDKFSFPAMSTTQMFHDAPFVDVPDRVFDGLYFGIRRYHKLGEGKGRHGMGGYELPETQRLRKAIENLEEELVSLLDKGGVSLHHYLWAKKLGNWSAA